MKAVSRGRSLVLERWAGIGPCHPSPRQHTHTRRSCLPGVEPIGSEVTHLGSRSSPAAV